MRNPYSTLYNILFLFILIYLLHSSANAQSPAGSGSIEIKESSPIYSKEKFYLNYRSEEKPIETITKHLREGAIHILKRYFSSESQFTGFISKFALTQAKALKSFSVESVQGNTITLIDLNDHKKVTIRFQIEETNSGSFVIRDASVSSAPISTQARSLQAQGLNAAPSVSSAWNYVLLPDSTDKAPKYYLNYVDAYSSYNQGFTGQDQIPYKQIDFEKLKIKFRWCKKVGPIKVCGNEEKTFTLGKVISGKDVPGNETSFKDFYFGELVDITAFTNSFEANYTQFKGYVLTAIIVDKKWRKLTFLREGLTPWQYGDDASETQFNEPIAVKNIGSYLYVLDNGYLANPDIKVLKINHSPDGDFSISYIGTISNSGNFQMSRPKDIGGYIQSSTNNVLLVADGRGLYSININPATGLPSTAAVRSYKQVTDPFESLNSYSLNNIKRLDASEISGSTVIITYNNEIISFSNNQSTSNNNDGIIEYDYYTKVGAEYDPSNLGYMAAEEKWYITDQSSKLHTLTKEGRYIAGGGKKGIGEDNSELYMPIGITPNTITDPTNDYRYRYIIANKWGYETGFKLFAPDLIINNFKVFEDLTNQNLVFTFSNSAKWQTVEKAKGITFSGLKINGATVSASFWNTQVIPGTIASPGNDLSGFPNKFNINVTSLPELKRGWNKAEIEVAVFIDGEPNKIIKKQANFYWLPSDFTPPSNLSNGAFKLNQNSVLGGESMDFIYKSITISDKGALYVDGNKVRVSEEGKLTFNIGSTYYNKNNSSDPWNNIMFDGSSKFNFSNGSYLCVKSLNYLHNDHLTLDPGYILGVNPPTLPEYSGGSCLSPCSFYASGSPIVDFTTDVKLVAGPSFNVVVNPVGTTYSDKIRWEISKVVPAGQDSLYASLIKTGKADSVNLRTLMNYNFLPCSDYKITLSIGCNQTNWIKSKTLKITTVPKVVAVDTVWQDSVVCPALSTVTFKGYSPSGGTWSSTTASVTSQGVFTVSSVSPGSQHNFTYSYTDAAGCSKSIVKKLAVASLIAAPVITTNSPVCTRDTLRLNTAYVPGAVYNWTLPNGVVIKWSSPNAKIPNITSAHSGQYKLTITINGCTSLFSLPVNVQVLPKPILTAGSNISTCLNTPSFQLTGQTPTGGTWSGSGVTPGGVFTPATAGYKEHKLIYSYTSSNGCTDTISRKVTVGPILKVGNDTTICLNQGLLTLTNFSPLGGSWTGNGITSPSGVFNPSTAGIGQHTISYSYTNSGCNSVATKKITIIAPPNAPTITSSGPGCYLGTVQLTASEIAGGTYEWKGPQGYISTQRITSINFLNGHKPGAYELTVKVGNCKSNPVTTTVVMNPAIAVSAGSNKAVCVTDAPITLTGSPSGGVWSGNSVSGNTFTPANGLIGENLITYIYTNTQGCSASSTAIYTVSPTLTVKLESNQQTIECNTDLNNLLLIANPVGKEPFTYSWTFNGTPIAAATGQSYKPTQAGNYCVSVTSGCGQTSACYNVIIAPPVTTKLKTSDCNITLSSLGQILNVDAISGATQYEYRVKDPSTGVELGRIARPGNDSGFNLSSISKVQYGKIYDVDVRAFINTSVCMSFGTVCKITTPPIPNAQLRSQDCNITLNSTTQVISVVEVSGATYYEYRVKNFGTATEVARVIKSSAEKELGIYNVPGIIKNASYDVDARAFISANNAWGTFGSVCKITIPCLITMPAASYSMCSGSNTNISLQSNPGGASFTWTTSLSSGTVTGFSNGSGNSITQNLTGNGSVTYQVIPTLGCVGAVTSYVVNVFTIPVLTSFDKVICSGQNASITLVSNIPNGVTYTWTASLISGNVTGFSNGSGNLISQILSGTGIVKFRVTPTNGSCIGLAKDFNVTVNASPIISPLNKTICTTQNTNIVLSSTPSGATFSWTATLISGNVSGHSNGTGTAISQTLNGSGVVRYQVTPTYNGCSGLVANYNVNVINSPLPVISPYSDEICSGGRAFFGIELVDYMEGVEFNWTASTVSGYVNGLMNGSGDLVDQVLVGDGVAKYSVTPYYNGCYGKTEDIMINVHSKPGLIINFNDPVDFPATQNITTIWTDVNNTIGTVTYWKDEAATIPVSNPNAISESGLYFIKKVSNYGCVGMQQVYLSINKVQNRNGLQYDGNNDYAFLPQVPALNLGIKDFTIDVNFKAFVHGIILSSRSSSSTPVDGFIIMLLGSSIPGKARIVIQLQGTPNYTIFDPEIFLNECYHLTLTRSGNIFSVYLDGNFIYTFVSSRNINSAYPIIIGRDSPSGSSFYGVIGEVRIWNNSRNPEQIKAYSDVGVIGNEAGLIGAWNMNEQSGQKLGDVSPNKFDGIIGATLSPDGNDPLWVNNVSCTTNGNFRTIVNTHIPDFQDSVSTNKFSPIVHPNPFNSDVSIEIPDENNLSVHLIVYDLKGYELLNTKKIRTNEAFKIGKEFKDGIYMVKAMYGNKIKVFKIIKKE